MRAFATLLLILTAGYGCHKPDTAADAKKSPQPTIRVATVVAAVKPTPDVLTITGTIIADQRAEVTADTQGKVINVMIERGQHVKLGQPVMQLDVRTAALSAREAQAALQSARVSKQLADEECARTKALLDKGAITKAEFDRQNTQCLNAVEQVAQAQARNDMMSKSVADGMVRAPFEGTVSEKHVSPGEWVNPGKPLFTLVDADPLKIELSVPEKAVTAIKIGDRVEVAAVAHPDQTFSATITRLGAEIGRNRALIVEATLDRVGSAGSRGSPPQASRSDNVRRAGNAGARSESGSATSTGSAPGTGSGGSATAAGSGSGSGSGGAVAAGSGSGSGGSSNAAVAAGSGTGSGGAASPAAAASGAGTGSERDSSLTPGMFAEARVTVGQTTRVALPATAVVRRDKTWHAFVVRNGVIEERVVQVGPSPGPQEVSISQGISEGEKVVTAVTNQIVDGAKVAE